MKKRKLEFDPKLKLKNEEKLNALFQTDSWKNRGKRILERIQSYLLCTYAPGSSALQCRIKVDDTVENNRYLQQRLDNSLEVLYNHISSAETCLIPAISLLISHYALPFMKMVCQHSKESLPEYWYVELLVHDKRKDNYIKTYTDNSLHYLEPRIKPTYTQPDYDPNGTSIRVREELTFRPRLFKGVNREIDHLYILDRFSGVMYPQNSLNDFDFFQIRKNLPSSSLCYFEQLLNFSVWRYDDTIVTGTRWINESRSSPFKRFPNCGYLSNDEMHYNNHVRTVHEFRHDLSSFLVPCLTL